MNIIRTVVTAAASFGLIAGLTACGAATATPMTYTRICEQLSSGQRVPAQQCENPITRPMAVWIYIPSQANVPDMGTPVMVGVRVVHDRETIIDAG